MWRLVGIVVDIVCCSLFHHFPLNSKAGPNVYLSGLISNKYSCYVHQKCRVISERVMNAFGVAKFEAPKLRVVKIDTVDTGMGG